MVLKKHGDILYQRFIEFERSWLVDEVRSSLRGVLPSSLFTDQTASVAGTSVSERRVAGEKFLKGLKQDWQDYQLCINMMSDVLMYLDRVYCNENRETSIHAACMGSFRDMILRSATSDSATAPTFMTILTNVILDQIRMERDGDIIDKQLIKACVYMLEGLYESVAETEDAKLYITSFEEEFLRSSRTFYKNEAESLLSETNAGAYCKHTTRRIKEEEDRCRSTLSEATLPKITKVVEDELIMHRLPDLIEMPSGVRNMVEHDLLEELSQLYDLSRRVDDKNTELTKAMQKLVVEKGIAINQLCQTTALSQTPGALPAQPEADGEKEKAKLSPEATRNQQTEAALKWVEEVLALKDKFDNIWCRSFDSDQLLQTKLTSSFTEFINTTTFTRSSEYISLFIDDNMKKGIKGKTENEIDAILEKAIILLRYIQDKDLFERYYKKHLCKRLLMNKSLSNDVEKQMVSRMKIELGNNFTAKLEAMFKDMTISADLTAGYKEYVSRLGDKDPSRIELSMHVLTSMTWPLEAMTSGGDGEDNQRTKCILPPAVERVRMGFEKFYAQKHSGRKLTWHANLGTADVRATFPKIAGKEGSKERRHELNVSTYAMVILCLFNDLPPGESLTFEEIQARTNIPAAELIRNLQSLAVAPKTRVLRKEPMSKDVNPSDKFYFNENFQSKFMRLKVGVVVSNKVEGDKERKETEKKNNDSRGFLIEAAVVRIMKWVIR